eukprot:GAHX01001190.1.p1 GENE.GAHX01001190.1~~GAHX01001190.1.p1  ORF type:complete len:1468 (-),score=358.89 GAHX01001190.1:31-4434(-)
MDKAYSLSLVRSFFVLGTATDDIAVQNLKILSCYPPKPSETLESIKHFVIPTTSFIDRLKEQDIYSPIYPSFKKADRRSLSKTLPPPINKIKEPLLYDFVLTEGEGSRLYASVLSFIYNDSFRSFAVVSRWAFLDNFKTQLLSIFDCMVFNQDTEKGYKIEKLISDFIYQVPLPPNGLIKVCSKVPFPNKEILKNYYFTENLEVSKSIESEDISLVSLIYKRNPQNKLPLTNYDQLMLFRALGCENVLTILLALLMERKVVIFSRFLEILTPIGETILSLIYPFVWFHVYIPFLPDNFSDILTAPVPFLLGCSSRSLLESITNTSDLLVVDLDHGSVDATNEYLASKLNMLPPKIKTVIWGDIRKHAKEIIKENSYKLNTKTNFMCKFDFNFAKQKLPKKIIDLRLSYLGLTLKILKHYQDHLLPNSDLFNLDKFLSFRGIPKNEFIINLFDSQAFIYFLQKSKELNQKDLSLVYFNEKIKQRVKIKSEFLEDQSMSITKTYQCPSPILDSLNSTNDNLFENGVMDTELIDKGKDNFVKLVNESDVPEFGSSTGSTYYKVKAYIEKKLKTNMYYYEKQIKNAYFMLYKIKEIISLAKLNENFLKGTSKNEVVQKMNKTTCHLFPDKRDIEFIKDAISDLVIEFEDEHLIWKKFNTILDNLEEELLVMIMSYKDNLKAVICFIVYLQNDLEISKNNFQKISEVYKNAQIHNNPTKINNTNNSTSSNVPPVSRTSNFNGNIEELSFEYFLLELKMKSMFRLYFELSSKKIDESVKLSKEFDVNLKTFMNTFNDLYKAHFNYHNKLNHFVDHNYTAMEVDLEVLDKLIYSGSKEKDSFYYIYEDIIDPVSQVTYNNDHCIDNKDTIEKDFQMLFYTNDKYDKVKKMVSFSLTNLEVLHDVFSVIIKDSDLSVKVLRNSRSHLNTIDTMPAKANNKTNIENVNFIKSNITLLENVKELNACYFLIENKLNETCKKLKDKSRCISKIHKITHKLNNYIISNSKLNKDSTSFELNENQILWQSSISKQLNGLLKKLGLNLNFFTTEHINKKVRKSMMLHESASLFTANSTKSKSQRKNKEKGKERSVSKSDSVSKSTTSRPSHSGGDLSDITERVEFKPSSSIMEFEHVVQDTVRNTCSLLGSSYILSFNQRIINLVNNRLKELLLIFSDSLSLIYTTLVKTLNKVLNTLDTLSYEDSEDDFNKLYEDLKEERSGMIEEYVQTNYKLKRQIYTFLNSFIEFNKTTFNRFLQISIVLKDCCLTNTEDSLSFSLKALKEFFDKNNVLDMSGVIIPNKETQRNSQKKLTSSRANFIEAYNASLNTVSNDGNTSVEKSKKKNFNMFKKLGNKINKKLATLNLKDKLPVINITEENREEKLSEFVTEVVDIENSTSKKMFGNFKEIVVKKLSECEHMIENTKKLLGLVEKINIGKDIKRFIETEKDAVDKIPKEIKVYFGDGHNFEDFFQSLDKILNN